MSQYLFQPPVAFVAITLALLVLYFLADRLSFKKDVRETTSYACGEDFEGHLIQPDYSQFFPYAYFFTILHVVAMVVATVPVKTPQTFALAFVYVVFAAIGLVILLRK
jgi:NADH-quinone oxidoreductase subunit A